jgi:glutaminyl-tRNA synthetase
MSKAETQPSAAGAVPEPRASNFLHDRIAEDVASKKYGDAVVQTRFPPEPNGYLHIGHAKAICINFMLADEFGGRTNLRFDDTNPEKEETEYVDSIMADVRWLGFQWDGLYYASDYFDQLYAWAVQLIKAGKAYVCDLTGEQVREYRGTLTEPGKESPYRNRTVEENLTLFERMKAGEFPDGARTLRAKIDMASPNMNMRDPIMRRTTAPATSGASIRRTTGRTASPTPSSASRTPCARSSSPIISRCISGTYRISASSRRSRSNSTA